MRLATLNGTIERRVLLNYRVAPEVAAALLPEPFAPQLYEGWAVVGIDLLRLGHLRPAAFGPGAAGFSSENAIHRVAVIWDEDAIGADCRSHQAGGGDGAMVATGIWVPRSDTSSRMSRAFGGRWFPGVQRLAHFDVDETPSRFRINMRSHDDAVTLDVTGAGAADLPATSLFRSLGEAARFFASGSVGWTTVPQPPPRSKAEEWVRRVLPLPPFAGAELRTKAFHIEPLRIETLHASFFDDPDRFPPGSILFDSAMIMRGVEHELYRRNWLRRLAPAAQPLRAVPG